MSATAPLSTAAINKALGEAAQQYAGLLRESLGNNLVSVVLFGSVARGEATADSDLDLLVICVTLPIGRFSRLRVLEEADRRFEDELRRLRARGIRTRLARIVKTRDEAARVVPLYLDLVEDARLLYDRGGFFASLLSRLRSRLARLGAERRVRGRIRYWVLKPDLTPGEVIEL
jgi:predicted nucleotidyltransferase